MRGIRAMLELFTDHERAFNGIHIACFWNVLGKQIDVLCRALSNSYQGAAHRSCPTSRTAWPRVSARFPPKDLSYKRLTEDNVDGSRI